MNHAVDNYFLVSSILQDDIMSLLATENDTQHWRRNFIRASASLIEGYIYCLKQMCLVSLECTSPKISTKESKLLTTEKKDDTNTKIKLTLGMAYKIFQLKPAPNFSGREWFHAQKIMDKRHLLMHPKTPSDLEVNEHIWDKMRNDIIWLLTQLFNFFSLLKEKYSSKQNITNGERNA